MMEGTAHPHGFDPFGTSHPEVNPPTWIDTDEWDEAAIPPRPWIAPGYFLRGAVTLLIGPGGVSKSALVIAYAVAMALGREFNGLKPRGRFRIAIYNTEDDQQEQRRRLSATLTSQGKMPADVKGAILRTGPTRTGLLFERDPDTGTVMPTLAMEKLERDLVAFGADVLFVDPLAELHGIEENDNTGMRSIIAEFRGLAVRCNLALGIIHHTRKGIVAPGDAEAGRGASSVIGAARVALTVTAMQKEDADAFGLPDGQSKRFFRVDGGKSNYATLTDAEWFERVPFELANGDQVAAAAPWTPPHDAIGMEVQAKVETAIRRGSSDGPWSPTLSDHDRSIRVVLVDAGVSTKDGQKKLLKALFGSGFQNLRFKDARRKMVSGIRSPDGFPVADWEDGDAPEGDIEMQDPAA